MAAARCPAEGNLAGIDFQLLGVRLGPANTVIDVLQRGRVAVRPMAEIHRDHDDAPPGQIFAEPGAVVEIARSPGAAMQIDIAGERAGAFRLEHARHDLALAVLQITDIFLADLRHLFGPPLNSISRRRGLRSRDCGPYPSLPSSARPMRISRGAAPEPARMRQTRTGGRAMMRSWIHFTRGRFVRQARVGLGELREEHLSRHGFQGPVAMIYR